jgi:AbrB family looped-hinge helix DNA binding protein
MVQLKNIKNMNLEVKMNLLSVIQKGQIVIPAPLRKKYHLRKGSKLRIEEIEGGIMLLKPLIDDLVEKKKSELKEKDMLSESLLKDRSRGKRLMKFAGMLSEKEADDILDTIYNSRQNKEIPPRL